MSDEEIRAGLKELTRSPVINKVAEVLDVDLTTHTCLVLPEGEAELEVRLKAGEEGVTDGIVEVPEIGSDVLISLIGNDPDTAYISKCSKVDKIIVNGGLLGGVIKIGEMVTEINERLNLLKTACDGAYSAQAAIDGSLGKNAFTAALATYTNLNRNDFEDTKFLH